MTSLKKYNSIFHDLMDESKNDINGCNAGCTTQEHYFGCLCWQACEAQYKEYGDVQIIERGVETFATQMAYIKDET
jgi:hypothetical protein